MADFTTLGAVLEAVVATAQATLQALNAQASARVGTPRAQDAARAPRLGVWVRGDRGVDHEGYSRRTARLTVVILAPDDKSHADLGATELLRLINLYEPVHYALLDAAEHKTGAFATLPQLMLREPDDARGIESDGFDDGDRIGRVGCTFEATYNRPRK